jgi:hypothetical protein
MSLSRFTILSLKFSREVWGMRLQEKVLKCQEFQELQFVEDEKYSCYRLQREITFFHILHAIWRQLRLVI